MDIFDSHKNNLDSSDIIGLWCGGIQKHSRKERIDRTIAQASYNFVVYLFEKYEFGNLVHKYHPPLSYRRERIDEDHANQIKYIYMDN